MKDFSSDENKTGQNKGSADPWLFWSTDQGGLLNVPSDAGKDAAESQWMREHHNASHALWYFSMIVYAVIHDKGYQNNRQKTERILAHLAHLREFISDRDLRGHKIVTVLCDALTSERPENQSQWTHFIYVHWNLIWSFAERYGHHEKCFPERDYKRICDIVNERQYCRGWWWQIKGRAMRKKAMSWLRGRTGQKV